MLIVQHPKGAFSLKPGWVRPNIHRRAPRLNYRLDHKQKAEQKMNRRWLCLKIIRRDMISAVIYIYITGWHYHLERHGATVQSVSFPVLPLSLNVLFNRDVTGKEMKVGLKEVLSDALLCAAFGLNVLKISLSLSLKKKSQHNKLQIQNLNKLSIWKD